MRRNYDASQLPFLFARCAAPIYIHELSHARDKKWAAEHGFAWPLTLEDE